MRGAPWSLASHARPLFLPMPSDSAKSIWPKYGVYIHQSKRNLTRGPRRGVLIFFEKPLGAARARAERVCWENRFAKEKPGSVIGGNFTVPKVATAACRSPWRRSDSRAFGLPLLDLPSNQFFAEKRRGGQRQPSHKSPIVDNVGTSCT